jgi:uncharacterized iron-regulated membrane protein
MTLRLFWRRFHLWTGVACGLFLVTMALSGTVLLFGAKLDRVLHPALYAVTGPAAAQPADVYLGKAKAAVPNGEPTQLRWPEETGFPLTVLMRLTDRAGRQGAPHANAPEQAASEHRAERNASPLGGAQPGAPAGRPRLIMVYLDPPTGEVLGTADPRASVVGWFRSLHEDLLVPAFGGRSIVGWNGIGLFVLCLTGLYLWWPRGASVLRALGWRRGPAISINLHHRVGFWIVIPLAVMAFTGIFQAFQPQGRALVGLFAPTTPQQMLQRARGGAPLPKPNLEPQQVLDAVLSNAGSMRPVLLALPSEPDKTWRVQVSGADGDAKTVLIEDATKAVSTPQALQGDAFLAFMRRIHDGTHDGPIWNVIVLLAGLSPPLLFVTGIMMWLRRRRNESRGAANRAADKPIASKSTLALDQDHIAA